jgi:hypothetical protein
LAPESVFVVVQGIVEVHVTRMNLSQGGVCYIYDPNLIRRLTMEQSEAHRRQAWGENPYLKTCTVHKYFSKNLMAWILITSFQINNPLLQKRDISPFDETIPPNFLGAHVSSHFTV